MGVMIAVTAFVIDVMEEQLTELRYKTAQKGIDGAGLGAGYGVYLAFSVVFGGLSVLLTCYVGPGAAGSGVAEVMGMLNGIVYPNCIGYRTLFTKVFGVALAVSGGLKVGKEGPLAHIGANIGVIALYLPLGFNKYFRNDIVKREVMAAGSGAGVAAAFGAPIGGALFAYEISNPANFWTFDLLWKTFFCTATTCFLLNFMITVYDNGTLSIVNGGIIKFGEFQKRSFTFASLIPFVIIGIICGILGAIYVYVNSVLMAKLRKKILTSNFKRIAECLFWVILSCSIVYFSPNIYPDRCPSQKSKALELIQYRCPEGTYNPLASLLMNTEGSAIKALFNESFNYNATEMLVFFLIWYVLCMLTYGTFVPSGLFVPGILMGCGLGHWIEQVIEEGIQTNTDPAIYAIVTASGILTGYTRLTFCIVVIMLETA